jgi:hypothetical protein
MIGTESFVLAPSRAPIRRDRLLLFFIFPLPPAAPCLRRCCSASKESARGSSCITASSASSRDPSETCRPTHYKYVLEMRFHTPTSGYLRIQPRLKQRRCITEAGGRSVWLLLLLLLHNNRYSQLDRLLPQINISSAATSHQRGRCAHQRVVIYGAILPSPIVFCICDILTAARIHRLRNRRRMQRHHDIGQKLRKTL